MKSLFLRLFVVFCLFTCPLFVFAQLPSYLPADGLVAWYPFNGNANDESGNGNNGMLGNVIAANGRNGDALGAFSMNNSSIQLSSNIKVLNNQSYTIGAWVKLNSAEETWLFSQRDYYGYNGAEVLFESNTVWPYYGQQNSTHQWQNLTPEGIPYYNFQFITCVINKSSNELLTYVNGILTGSFSISGISNVENTSTAVIGRKPTSNGNCSFIIDEFFFYDRALTVNEIADVYQNSLPVQQFSSAPPGIPYQAEVRNESGEVLAIANVNIRFTLHELAANGTVSYQETHTLTTNELGLFAANIGTGTATQGTFASINWAQTTKFLQVEVDAGNGFITMGNQQLMSVPYALYAANGPQGPIGPQGLRGEAGPAGPQGPQGPQGASAPASNGSFSHYIGERFGGGIVFHVYRDTLGEEHGLIVAKHALAYGPFCICDALENFDNPTNSFDGKHNTEALLSSNLFSQGAISLVSNFSINGFDDWYLPSIDEVELLMSKGYSLKSSGFQFLSPQLSDFTPFRWNMVLSSTITNPGSNILMWTGTGTEGSWGINYQIPQGEGNILAVRKF